MFPPRSSKMRCVSKVRFLLNPSARRKMKQINEGSASAKVSLKGNARLRWHTHSSPSNASFHRLARQRSLRTCLLPALLVCLTSSSPPNSPSTFHHFLLAADSLQRDKASCGHPTAARTSDLGSRPAGTTTEGLSFREAAPQKPRYSREGQTEGM